MSGIHLTDLIKHDSQIFLVPARVPRTDVSAEDTINIASFMELYFICMENWETH